MKSLLVFVFAICLLIISCKKEQQHASSTNAHGSGKKYAVKFTGSVFSQYSTGISMANGQTILSTRKASSISDTTSLTAAGITEYYYVVYDSTGTEISRIVSVVSNGRSIKGSYHNEGFIGGYTGEATYEIGVSNELALPGPFDTITDSLAAGKYTVVIVAQTIDTAFANHSADFFFIDAHEEGVFHGGVGFLPLSSAFFDNLYDLNGPQPTETDTYAYRGTIVVGAHDSDHSYVLSRVTGQLTVNVEDAIPPNVTTIQLGILKDCDGLTLADFMPYDGTPADEPSILSTTPGQAFPISSDKIGKTNTQYGHPILNTATPLDIVLIAWTNTGDTLAVKRIKGVSVPRNEKVILTGKLFDNLQTMSTKKIDKLAGSKATIVHF